MRAPSQVELHPKLLKKTPRPDKSKKEDPFKSSNEIKRTFYSKIALDKKTQINNAMNEIQDIENNILQYEALKNNRKNMNTI